MRVKAATLFVLCIAVAGCSSGFEDKALGVRWEPPHFAQGKASTSSDPVPTAHLPGGVSLRRVSGEAPSGRAEAMLAEVVTQAGLGAATAQMTVRSHRSGTLPAGRVERFELDGGAERTLLYVVRGDGAYLVLTMTAERGEYSQRENHFERSLASLRFR